MKTRTVTVREGEDMGPITDWSHPFVAKALEWNKGLTLETLQEMAAHPERFRVSNYGGWPRIWQPLIRVCLYDGWPYWTPVPSLLVAGPLGPEWMLMDSLTGVERRREP